MTLEYLDPKSYTFEGGFTVQNKRDLTIPESLVLSQTMLVKWQIRNLVKGVTIDQIPPAILSSSLEISGLGVLDGDEYQIAASQQGRDRVQLITLDPSLPHKFLFTEVSDLVTNSVLEFYTSTLTMGSFNNPVNVTTDLSPVVSAIAAGSAAEVAAIAAQTAAATRQAVKELESIYTATVWSNVPGNHIAVPPEAGRMGGSFLNTGTKPIAVDKFVDIATKTAAAQYDGTIQPGGTYNFGIGEETMGYLLYALTPGGTTTVAINLER
jgi:hypothetical protein